MAESEPFVTNLELRASTPEGEAGAGLSHRAEGLVLLHVLELAAYGEPRGAVTCVHDAGDHGGRYLALARRLARESWAIALPDLRGHGRSEGLRGHSNGIREIVRDLGDVQDHLAYRQPDARKVLVGQGLGALWCLAYACEKPGGVEALVLCAPLIEPRFERAERSGGLRKLFKKPGPDTPGRIGWDPAQLTSDAEQQRALRADELVHDVITLRAAEQASEAAARYVPQIGMLPMPVLVLAGSDDPVASAERARQLAGSNVEVRVFDGLRHDLFHESRAGEVITHLTQWLDLELPR